MFLLFKPVPYFYSKGGGMAECLQMILQISELSIRCHHGPRKKGKGPFKVKCNFMKEGRGKKIDLSYYMPLRRKGGMSLRLPAEEPGGKENSYGGDRLLVGSSRPNE